MVYIIENEDGLFWSNKDGWVLDPREAETYTNTEMLTIGEYVPYPDVIIGVSGGVAEVLEVSLEDLEVVIVDFDE